MSTSSQFPTVGMSWTASSSASSSVDAQTSDTYIMVDSGPQPIPPRNAQSAAVTSSSEASRTEASSPVGSSPSSMTCQGPVCLQSDGRNRMSFANVHPLNIVSTTVGAKSSEPLELDQDKLVKKMAESVMPPQPSSKPRIKVPENAGLLGVIIDKIDKGEEVGASDMEHVFHTRQLQTLHQMFGEIPDHRRVGCGNFKYPLDDILTTCCLAGIAGMLDYTKMSIFTKEQEDWLQGIGYFEKGTPGYSTIERCVNHVGSERISQIVMGWIRTTDEYRHIAVDGKRIRGAGFDDARIPTVLRFFSVDEKKVVAQQEVSEDHNEMSQMKILVNFFNDLRGAILSLDAAFCYREIVVAIKKLGGEFCIGLKDNQPTLFTLTKIAFECSDLEPIDSDDVGHGRVEHREVYTLDIPDDFPPEYKWPGVKKLVMVVRTTTYTGKKYNNKQVIGCRYFITSLTDDKIIAKIIREHWLIENVLHNTLDKQYGEDASSIRAKNGPINMSTFRCLASMIMFEAQEVADSSKVTKTCINHAFEMHPSKIYDFIEKGVLNVNGHTYNAS